MKSSIFLSIVLMIIGGFLASSGALARQGGIPQCEMELAECTIDLETCEETVLAFPVTGQTSCWDVDGIEISCDGTGHDGDIQAGAELSYIDTGLTIIDSNTKLEWMKQDANGGDCASAPGYFDMNCDFTWDEGFAFIDALNIDPCFADHCDWRMPNVKELITIANYQKLEPAVSEAFHDAACITGCVLPNCSCTNAEVAYWTSTTYIEFPIYAWVTNFYGGGFAGVSVKDYHRYVRAVRGGL